MKEPASENSSTDTGKCDGLIKNSSGLLESSSSAAVQCDSQSTASDRFRVPWLSATNSSALSHTKSCENPEIRSSSRLPTSNNRNTVMYSTSAGARSSTKCSSSTTNASSQFIIAIAEGRGVARGEVGMACIDLKNPILFLYQFADTQTYNKLFTQLNILDPTEILLPITAAEGGASLTLFQRLTAEFLDVSVGTVKRKYFNETRGLQLIKDLCIPDRKTIELEVMQKYYCLASCSALVKYVEFVKNITFARDSLKIVFKVLQNTTMIDTTTAAKLEIVTNEFRIKSEDTLYGVLHKTRTLGGSRFLRANLLQPPTDLKTIEMRQDCITELIDNDDLFERLRVLLGQFVDCEQVLLICVTLPKDESFHTAEVKISNAICLKHILDLIEPLKKILDTSTNELFQAYRQGLCDPRFDELKQKISLVIHTDAKCLKGALNTRIQKCFSVKQNINGLLDIARRTYSELVDDISEMMEQMCQQYNLPIRLGYGAARGFYLQISAKTVNLSCGLPPIFLKVNQSKNVVTCTTKDLIRLNNRIKDSLNEIYMMSNVVISELFTEIRGNIGCLYKLTEVVATIDFLVCLALYAAHNKCVKPQFANSLALKNSRHPILEKTCPTSVVPNNVFISSETNFIIVTGPNMSGKTTYLKQVALLQIMAQMGSYVPAEFASFCLIDQIFSRLGCTENIKANCSTFTLEMKECSYILSNLTERSMIIIDELGRGTSFEEGESVAWAIAEEILLSKAFTLFTTHFKHLTHLEATYLNAANYYFSEEFSYDEDNHTCNIGYSYTIKRGYCKSSHYGLKLAEWCMPTSVVEDARNLCLQIGKEEEGNILDSEECLKRRETVQLVIHILQVAQNSTLEIEDLCSHLRALQNEFKSASDNNQESEDVLTQS